MAQNLSKQLEKSLGQKRLELVRNVADKAFALGFSTYLAGGMVRDLLLKRPSSDVDILVHGDAIKLSKALVKEYGGKVTSHQEFGTASWQLADHKANAASVDLTTARTETYEAPGSLPAVTPAPVERDLQRRDFTINAMAVCLDIDRWGDLLDPAGGEQDLRQGLIRVLHPGSFKDDPTRMYRAVRYEKRFGFSMTPDAEALIPGARPLVERLSAERIRHELDLILEEAGAAPMLGRLAELDLLGPIHPALKWNDVAARRLTDAPATAPFPMEEYSLRDLRWILWLIEAIPDEISSLNSRLGFEAKLHRALRAASLLYSEVRTDGALPPSGWVKRLEHLPPLAVYAVSLAVEASGPRQALLRYLAEWRQVQPRAAGTDLKDLGLPPGPLYAQILGRLRAAWLDGELTSPDEERSLLARLVSEARNSVRPR